MLLEKNDKRKDSLLPCVCSRREYMTSKCGKNKIEAYEACVTDVLTTSWPLCVLLIPKRRPSEVSWVENTKARHRKARPKVASWRMSFESAFVYGPSFLAEDDFPGSSLKGGYPSQLKNSELKFRQQCRGDNKHRQTQQQGF